MEATLYLQYNKTIFKTSKKLRTLKNGIPTKRVLIFYCHHSSSPVTSFIKLAQKSSNSEGGSCSAHSFSDVGRFIGVTPDSLSDKGERTLFIPRSTIDVALGESTVLTIESTLDVGTTTDDVIALGATNPSP